MSQHARTALLLGEERLARLQAARVAVFGIGGVGGYAAEALVRSGVGAIDLFDGDEIAPSNLNRQIIALHSTLDRPKVEVMAERMRDIAPEVRVRAQRLFYLPAEAGSIDFAAYDYIVDAVDTVAAKIDLAVRAQAAGVPLIMALGAGNKLDPTQVRVSDLYETRVDPLARVLRRELRSRGIESLRVAWSPEPPLRACGGAGEAPPPGSSRRAIPGSMVFVPAAMGMAIAAEVVRCLAFRGQEPERLRGGTQPEG